MFTRYVLAAALSAFAAPALAQDVSLLPYAQLEVRDASAMAMSPAGATLAIGTKRNTVALIDLDGRRVRRELAARGRVRAISFSANGKLVFVATEGRDILALDTTGAIVASRRLDKKPASIDAAGELVVVASEAGNVELFTQELLPVRRLAAPNFYDRDASFVAIGQAGKEIFAAGDKAVSAYWSVARGEAIRTSSPNRTEILAGARDPGGDMLLLGVKQFSMTRDMSSNFSITPSYSIQLYDWATGKLTKEIDGLRAAIRGVAIAPVRTIVATADEKGQVSLWNISQNRDVASARMTDYPIGLAFTADGRYLATAGEKGNIFVWKASGVSPNHVVARVYDTEGLLTKGKYEITTATEPLFGPRDSFSMAILGLNALGVDATLTRTVDNLIAARFADYGNLRLVERDAVDRVLKEVKFQNSGLTSVQDAAKIGSMLNAEKVVVGSVNQLGTSVVVSLRVVESATARINGAREVMCNDCTAEDLPKALSLLVRAVMGAR